MTTNVKTSDTCHESAANVTCSMTVCCGNRKPPPYGMKPNKLCVFVDKLYKLVSFCFVSVGNKPENAEEPYLNDKSSMKFEGKDIEHGWAG